MEIIVTDMPELPCQCPLSKQKDKINCKETTDYREYGLTTYNSTERYPKSVWKFAKDTQKSAYHSTQKPVALIEELIKTYTNPGDLILDSCAGSMTAAIAAINTNRNYICIEKDEDIFKVGQKRVYERYINQNMLTSAT